MTLDQLDRAVALRNFRRNVIRLSECAASGYMALEFGGEKHPDSHISLQCVRDAVIAECERERRKYETELAEMGVIVEDALALHMTEEELLEALKPLTE